MNLFPAIDLYEGKAVRLFQGNYDRMTVYSSRPTEVAEKFQRSGARFLHLVDLEGARNGTTPNLSVVREILEKTSLFVEMGGGIRNMETVDRYLGLGVNRVILGTAAVKDGQFLKQALEKYGHKIAVGVDLKDSMVAIHGWTENSGLTADDFLARMQTLGVQTVICTDISKDGAMKGTNRDLYRELSRKFSVDLIASGGVSSLEDIRALKAMGLSGAIIGKACYTGAVDLREALEAAE